MSTSVESDLSAGAIVAGPHPTLRNQDGRGPVPHRLNRGRRSAFRRTGRAGCPGNSCRPAKCVGDGATGRFGLGPIGSDVQR